MTGFFGLWREAFGSTNRIDGVYRTLMASGQADVTLMHLREILKARGAMSSAAVRYSVTWFTHFNSWNRHKALGPPGLRPGLRLQQSAVGSFFLRRRMTPFRTKARQVLSKGESVLPLLTYEAWTNDQMFSIEHVAPQTATDNWDTGFTNLLKQSTAVFSGSTDVNASLSNEPWEVRSLLPVISAASPDEAEAAKKTEDAGIKLIVIAGGEDADEYRPLAAGIAACEGTWDPEMVDHRSRRLAEIAWDRLAPWVGLTSS